MNTTGNDYGTMNALMSSSTGRKLLADAERRGVKLEFKPDKKNAFNPNTNTITIGQDSLEKMTEHLGHELVHATTRENGNSMKEEKMAFIIGEQVASEAGVNNNPHSESFWNNHVDKAYKNDGLKADNGIMGALSFLNNDVAQAAPQQNNDNSLMGVMNSLNTAADQGSPINDLMSALNSANSGFDQGSPVNDIMSFLNPTNSGFDQGNSFANMAPAQNNDQYGNMMNFVQMIFGMVNGGQGQFQNFS